MGGLVAMVALTKLTFGYSKAQIGLLAGANLVLPMNGVLYGTIIIAGLVCTSRLILKAHVIKDVYGGFLIGLGSIVIAYFILR